ncbi:MAG: hypothetical protein A2X68_13280 [Ignavibacteria bacterium GWC2_56_12]|nr:MAG: hypothetical protein A2X68_13280 [Ignavibacteria bacterium GWC2_56_12]
MVQKTHNGECRRISADLSRRLILHALGVIVVGIAACEREIVVNDPSIQIDGYGVQGIVYDRFGNGVQGVDVYVDYGRRFVDYGPEPSRVYTVVGQQEEITVTIVYSDGSPFAVVATQSGGPGAYEYLWNKRDALGNPAPPGAYFVRYVVGGQTKHSYPVVVFGTKVTESDANGRYSITNRNLPVDFYPVAEYTGSTYYGNSQITDEIFVFFESSQSTAEYRLTLAKNQLIRKNVGLN